MLEEKKKKKKQQERSRRQPREGFVWETETQSSHKWISVLCHLFLCSPSVLLSPGYSWPYSWLVGLMLCVLHAPADQGRLPASGPWFCLGCVLIEISSVVCPFLQCQQLRTESWGTQEWFFPVKMNFDHIEPFVFGVDYRVCVYFPNDKEFQFSFSERGC